jgi:integrase
MDVEEIDETTWALLIQPHALRALKTRSSRRNIPVHPTILSLGFADFVRARKKQAEATGKPEAPLFPGIRMKQRGQVGYNIGRWFSELVDDLRLEGRNLGFHSLRHNFEDALRRARIAETAQGNYLSGRSSRLPNSGRTYGDGWKTMVAELKTEMAMVSYPGLDLSAVRPWKAPGGS